MDFERQAWKFATLGVTAVVLGNIIVNWRGPVELVKATGQTYVNVLNAIRR
jgi:hypothetical protein